MLITDRLIIRMVHLIKKKILSPKFQVIPTHVFIRHDMTMEEAIGID